MSTHTLPGSSSGPARGAAAYRTVNAQSSSPLELVIMLYDGAIRFLQLAKEADERKELRARANHMARALAIVGELHNTLNLDDGEAIAQDLDRLYDYMMVRLLDVTTKRDATALAEVQRLLSTLREGWAAVSSATASPPRP
jgi:flagellar protein FliS